jgi:beta-glucosidase
VVRPVDAEVVDLVLACAQLHNTVDGDVKSTVSRPLKELKSFAKVELAPGESKTVFRLGKRAFSDYNVDMRDWHVESGVFEIMAARSSQDVVLIETVEVESTITLATTFGCNSTIGDLLEHPVTA